MNKSSRRTQTILLVVATVLCFTGVAAAQGGQKIDACTLLNKAEIQAVIGQNVGDGKLNTKANPAVGLPCEYVIGSSGVFSILVKAVGPGETASASGQSDGKAAGEF